VFDRARTNIAQRLLFPSCGICLGEANVGSDEVYFLLVQRPPNLFGIGTLLCFEHIDGTGRGLEKKKYSRIKKMKHFYIEKFLSAIFCLTYDF
jgi:hypothetical protein